MKSFALVILFNLSIGLTYSQTIGSLDKDTSVYKRFPLFILKIYNQSPIESITFPLVDNHSIDSLNILNEKTLKTYGEKGKYGVMVVTIKAGVELLKLPMLLKKYSVKNQDITPPVFIDLKIANHPEIMLYEPKAIKSLTINTEKSTGMKFIDIRSFTPPVKLKKGEYFIR